MTMDLDFKGIIWYWKGPAPFFFITIPQAESDSIKGVSSQVTYGWGVVLVSATIGDTTFKTSLIPKDGKYLLPVKAAVRKAECLYQGDEVRAKVEIRF